MLFYVLNLFSRVEYPPADYLSLFNSKLTIIKIYLINFPTQSSRKLRLGRKNVILYLILIFWPLLVYVIRPRPNKCTLQTILFFQNDQLLV